MRSPARWLSSGRAARVQAAGEPPARLLLAVDRRLDCGRHRGLAVHVRMEWRCCLYRDQALNPFVTLRRLAYVMPDGRRVGVHVGCAAGCRGAGEHLVEFLLHAPQIRNVPERERLELE